MPSEMPDVTVILGTRPEMIKLAPVVRELEERDVPTRIVHTGQHYSESLDDAFFDTLNLPQPDVNLHVGSGDHGRQTATMLEKIEADLLAHEPGVVLVQGDTNSVLAGALATAKLPPALGHVEAGLRSYDREMPEEVNRRVTDHVADFLFAPTEDAATKLGEEGLGDDLVYVTGNTVVDAVFDHRAIARDESEILDDLGLAAGEYVLFTAHRPENVDDPDTFRSILQGAGEYAAANDLSIVYPVHPRSRNRLDEFDIAVPDPFVLTDPLDYLDFLRLEGEASLVVTDSGGVQEEACILGVPCVTVRTSTERPETLEVGANHLAGVERGAVREACERMAGTSAEWANPYGDGDAAERIVDVLLDHLS